MNYKLLIKLAATLCAVFIPIVKKEGINIPLPTGK